MGAAEPVLEKGEERVADVLTKTALKLLEFLITENEVRYYSLTDLAARLGISVSTVSRECRKLIDIGILIEYNYPRSNKGRPIKVVEIDYRNPIADIMVKWMFAFRSYLDEQR